jgi:NADH-ubiquinone oxidoreductase chain 5
MEGPTPVSALIHAATMVTAGIYLIIRCSILFETTTYILPLITLIGVLTAFFASTIGLLQFDIKKVIAYSTCSQLGYMVFTCGLSQYNSAIFHLINHAFFKALLFLTAGAVIHSMSGEQDIRQFGALVKILPFTYICLLIGSLALIGFPFFAGFYSKDNILELCYSNYTFYGNIAFAFGSIAALFTSYYSFRILHLTFYAKNTSYIFFLKKVHELPKSLGLSLFFLALGSIFFGFFAKDIFVGIGSNF